MASALPTNLDEVFGEYWKLKKERLAFLRDFVHRAQLLAFTPRTERQRADMAVKAGQLVLEEIPNYRTKELLGAALLEIVTKPFRKAEREQTKAGFHTLKHRYRKHAWAKMRFYRSGKRLQELPFEKWQGQLALGLESIRVANLRMRWPEVERRLGVLLGRTAQAIKGSALGRIREVLKMVVKPDVTKAIRKLNRVAKRCYRVEGNYILYMIATYNSGKRPINQLAVTRLVTLLQRHLCSRFRVSKATVYRCLALRRLASLANYKKYERRAVVFYRFQTWGKSQSIGNRSFLTLTRALKVIPGLGRRFANAIVTNRINFQKIKQNDSKKVASRLVFEYAIRKLVGKDKKFLLFAQRCAWEKIQYWPNWSLYARRLASYMENVRRSEVGWRKRRLIGELLRGKVKPKLGSLRKVTCFCLTARKALRRKTKKYQQNAIRRWKSGMKVVKREEKIVSTRAIAAKFVSLTLKRAFIQRLAAFRVRSTALPAKSLSRLFQKMLCRAPSRYIKSLCSCHRHAICTKSTAETTLPGLLRIRRRLRSRCLFKSFQRLLKCMRIRGKVSGIRTAYLSSATIRSSTALKKLVNVRILYAFDRMKSRLLTSQLKVERMKAIVSLEKAKGLRWTRVTRRVERLIGLLRLNHHLQLTKAVSIWLSRSNFAMRREREARQFWVHVEELSQRRMKFALGRMKAVSVRKQAVLRLLDVLSSAELIENRSAEKCFFTSLGSFYQRSKKCLGKLMDVFPIARKFVQMQAFNQWSLQCTCMEDFMDTADIRLDGFCRTIERNYRLNVGKALDGIREKARSRKKLPIALLSILGNKVKLAQSYTLEYLKNSRLVYSHITAQKLLSLTHLTSAIRSADIRITHECQRSFFLTYRLVSAVKRQACNRLARCLSRTHREIYSGCFELLCTETARDYNERAEVSISHEREQLYSLLRVVASVPSRVETEWKRIAFESLRSVLSQHQEAVTYRSTQLASLKRAFISHYTVTDKPSIRLCFSLWSQSTFERKLVTYSPNAKLRTALSALARLASYRLSFQAFEAIYTTASLRDISHGVFLCRKVASRQRAKGMVKSMRRWRLFVLVCRLDYERTASLLAAPMRIRDLGWRSTLETASDRSSPEGELAETAFFPTSKQNYSPIPDSQPSPQPGKLTLDMRKVEMRTPSTNGLRLASPCSSEVRLEAMPLYSSPYYPYKSFMTMQLEGSFSDRGDRNDTPMSTKSAKRFH